MRTRWHIHCLLAAIVLIPVQIFPVLPLPGMQLADLAFAAAFATAPLAMPAVRLRVWLAVFAVGSAASWLVAGGSAAKLIGHFELCAIAWMVAVAWDAHGCRLRRALVGAAALAAMTGLVGVVFYYLGIDTALLNPHHGDLVASHYPRVRGTAIRANMLASIIVTGMALLAFEASLVRRRCLRMAALAVMALCLVFTFSRTVPAAGLALVAGALVCRRAPSWQWLLWAVFAFVYATVLWISIRYTVVLNPLDLGATEILDRPGTRYVHWRGTAWTLGEHPWFGVGPGNTPDGEWSAHNTWLDLWAVLGLAPFVAFVALLGGSLRRGVAAGIGLAVALWIVASDSIHRDIEDMRHVWVLLGAVWAERVARSYRGGAP